jgi:hypothetical protein
MRSWSSQSTRSFKGVSSGKLCKVKEVDGAYRPETGCKGLVLSAADDAQHKKTIASRCHSNGIPVSQRSIGDSVLRLR